MEIVEVETDKDYALRMNYGSAPPQRVRVVAVHLRFVTVRNVRGSARRMTGQPYDVLPSRLTPWED